MRKLVYLVVVALAVPAFVAAQQIGKTGVQKGTWKGVVLEQSCYQKLGVEKASAAEHNACAMDCLKKGQALGLLTDEDGYMKIIGDMTKNNNAKLAEFIGKRVEATGESSLPTGNYLPRQIEVTKIVVAKK